MVAFLCFPAYFVICHGSLSGQTPGKKVCRIAVRDAESFSRIGYGRALWRFIIQIVLGWIPVVGIVNVLAPLWTERKQAWHDRGARTVVVRA